jgi:hypothetical protein
MILSGKKLFMYRVNKIANVISMFAIVAAAIAIFSMMFIAFC